MSLRRNSLTNAFGGVARLLIGIALIPVLLRALGLGRYGVWAVLSSLVALSAVAEFGLGTALTVQLAGIGKGGEGKALRGTAFTLACGFGLLATAGWIVAIVPLASSIFGSYAGPDLRGALFWLTIGLIPRLWQQIMCGWEGAVERYDLRAGAETIGFLLLNVGVVAGALMGAPFTTLALVWDTATCLTVALHIVLMRAATGHLPGLAWDRASAGRLLRFGFSYWLSNLGGALFSRLDRLLISAPLGFRAVAVYAAATSVASKLNELPLFTLQPFQPAVSGAAAAGRFERMQALFTQAFTLNALVVYVPFTSIVWLAPWIALLVIPANQTRFTIVLQALAIIYASYSLAGSAYHLLLGLGRPYLPAGLALTGAALTLVPMYWVATRYGLLAASLCNAGYCVILVLVPFAARTVGLHPAALLRQALPVSMAILVTELVHLVVAPHFLPVALSAWALSLTAIVWIAPQQSAAVLTAVRVRWLVFLDAKRLSAP